MIYRHTEEQIQDYFDNPDINQTGIKVIIDKKKGIEQFIVERDQLQRQTDLYYEEKKHFVIGSAVDVHITQGEEVFKNKYHYSNLQKKPSDTVKSIVNMVYDRVASNTPIDEIMPFLNYKEEIYAAANEHQYSMNRKAPTEKQLKEEEKKLALAKEAGAEAILLTKSTNWALVDNRWSSMKNAEYYWADLILANGKQVLTEGEYNIINSIILSFLNHPFTSYLFKDSEDIDILYQTPLFWQYADEGCKGLLDMIRIQHSSKRIMPIDFKTLGNYILTFPQAVKDRRYDIQGSWYHYGISQCLDYISKITGKDCSDYTIAPICLLAESTIKPGTPLKFLIDDDLMLVGTQGDGKWQDGWYQGMVEYKKWKEKDFSIDAMFKETNGLVKISSNYQMY